MVERNSSVKTDGETDEDYEKLPDKQVITGE
jgi:hypothetical protein